MKEKNSRAATSLTTNSVISIDPSDSTFDDAVTRLSKLCSLLSSDSEHVKDLVLQDLSHVLQAKESLLRSRFLVSGSDAASNVITQLITQLLDINRRTSSTLVRQRCAVCLGQIGAVDPSRVSPTAPHEQVSFPF